MSVAADSEHRRDRGAVTVEAAIALCSLLVVFGLVLAGVRAVTGQLQCTDAAGAAARMLVRGESQRAEDAVEALAPPGATLTVRSEGHKITVTVTAEPLGGFLPGVELSGRAYAVLEPGVDLASSSARAAGADHANA